MQESGQLPQFSKTSMQGKVVLAIIQGKVTMSK
jgi:hypothetical protein